MLSAVGVIRKNKESVSEKSHFVHFIITLLNYDSPF